jgi:hypothetical protein
VDWSGHYHDRGRPNRKVTLRLRSYEFLVVGH